MDDSHQHLHSNSISAERWGKFQIPETKTGFSAPRRAIGKVLGFLPGSGEAFTVLNPCARRWNQQSMNWTRLISVSAVLWSISGTGQEIPEGTLLPIQLRSGIKVGKIHSGERVSGKLMQPVRLHGAQDLPRGAVVSGRVVDAQELPSGAGSRIVLAFDRVRFDGKEIPISASLRALASMKAVFDAQLPTNLIDDYGSTVSDWNTVQVGGQGVYRGAGIVMSGPDVVGRASDTGLVTGRPTASPNSPCARDIAASKAEQSLWIFSTNACGTYGFEDLSIAHAGRSSPIGEIQLESRSRLDVRGGSGWLLTVLSAEPTLH